DSTAQRLARNPSSLEDRVERANALRAAGLDKAAGEEARKALESHPSSRAALVLAANLPRPEQFHHPGIKLAAENLAGGSATAENLRRLAALDLEVERGGAAARAERARLLVAMRQPLLALEDAGGKDSVNEALARLEALAALGRAREASALAARIASQDRKSAAQAWTLATEALLQSWETERAEAAASRAIERGGSRRAHELRAAARQRLGDEEGARADLAAASKAVR
ncbi:MAG: hypothetical protein N2322_06705, partial [Terrimicrobiaceae bacterium]|nr:hypothetical protein [Terrimicrobiaceae bacterium]